MNKGDKFSLKLSTMLMGAHSREIIEYNSCDELIALGPEYAFSYDAFVVLAEYNGNAVIIICAKELFNAH